MLLAEVVVVMYQAVLQGNFQFHQVLSVKTFPRMTQNCKSG